MDAVVFQPMDFARASRALASERMGDDAGGASQPVRITAHPFDLAEASSIPPRQWLYGRHYIRSFVSATVAPGGVGKTALITMEALAIATGRPLLGLRPSESVPVWIMSLEDPVDEFARRIAAACLLHGIPRDCISGRVYATHGRDAPLAIATLTKFGPAVARPVVDAICAEVARLNVGLVIVDPFVGSHAVPENDNGAINAVVSAWRDVAERTGAAVELVHHTRKTGGAEITVEDGRGGSALHGAVRSMRALNVMTEDEAARAAVENRRLYFRADYGKANLAPPSATSDWYRLESVDLGNGTAAYPGDQVGVATRWQWPDPMAGVSGDHLNEACRMIDAAEPPYRPTSSAARWVGEVVAEVVGLDAADPTDKAKISSILAAWYRSGAIVKLDGVWRDASRKLRPIVRSNRFSPST